MLAMKCVKCSNILFYFSHLCVLFVAIDPQQICVNMCKYVGYFPLLPTNGFDKIIQFFLKK